MKIMHRFMVLSLLFGGIALASCSTPGHVVQTSDRNIVSISVLEETIPEWIVEGKFDEAGIQARISYSDDSFEDIPITSSLLGSYYAPLLSKEGYYDVSILYRGVNVQFQIHIVKASYTVRFFAYEDSPTYTLVETLEVPYATALTAPEIPLDLYDETNHYTFTGWDRALDRVTEPMDIYALYDHVHWYTVRFYNGENALLDVQVLDEGEDAVVPANYAMEGYEFAGWDRDYHNVTKDLDIRGLYFKMTGQAEVDEPDQTIPTPVEKQTSGTVFIANKAALQQSWPLEERSRALSLYLAPKVNVLDAIADGSLIITSSDESVLTVAGIRLIAASAGTATITATYGGSSDSVSIVVNPYSPGMDASNPLSVDEALSIAAPAYPNSTDVTYYIEGYVTFIKEAYNSLSRYATFYIGSSADMAKEESLYMYRISADSDEVGEQILKGAKVLVKCALTNYKGTPENRGGYVLSAEGGEVPVRPTGHGWEENDPFTVAEALARCEALEANINDEFDCYVAGVVSDINAAYYPTYGNISVNIVDDGAENKLLVDRLACTEEQAGQLTPGAQVVVNVVLKKYQSTSNPGAAPVLETASGGSIISLVPGQAYVPLTGHGWEESDPFTVAEAFLQEDNAQQDAYVKGYIVEIKTAYSADYGNISLMIADAENETEAANKYQLYRLACTAEEAEALVFGAQIIAKGKLASHNGTKQMGAGCVAISVTSPLTPIEPATQPDPVAATIAELKALTANVTANVYSVSGIWEAGKGDQYGDGYLTDPVTGDSIMVYGATTTATAIAFDGSSGQPVFSFTNPKDAKTALADLHDGMIVSGTALFKYYNGTPEILMVIDNMAASDSVYTATVEENEFGSVVLSKSEGIQYGEEITVSELQPAQGYRFDKLTVTNAQGKETDITESMKFNATCVNHVKATFVSDDTPPQDENVVAFNLGADFTENPSHYDGAEVNAYEEGTDPYKLTLTDLVKVSAGANDVQGNGCLKLGTGSKAGSFVIEVPENVTKVIFSVAGYKGSDAKVAINDAEEPITVSTHSDDGEYTDLEATPVGGYVMFSTRNGGTRAMINSITFVIGGVADIA